MDEVTENFTLTGYGSIMHRITLNRTIANTISS